VAADYRANVAGCAQQVMRELHQAVRVASKIVVDDDTKTWERKRGKARGSGSH
jgi:ornithine cyclodeaminase/alanine dehydrogenase-like protein (mu-crystallin family)